MLVLAVAWRNSVCDGGQQVAIWWKSQLAGEQHCVLGLVQCYCSVSLCPRDYTGTFALFSLCLLTKMLCSLSQPAGMYVCKEYWLKKNKRVFVYTVFTDSVYR